MGQVKWLNPERAQHRARVHVRVCSCIRTRAQEIPRSKREHQGRFDHLSRLCRFERGSIYSQGSRHASAELRNVEAMNFQHIKKGIAKLGKKAREGDLTIEDTVVGPFTMFVFGFSP